MPRRLADEMPPEVWSNLAVAIALESGLFGIPLGEALHDQLAWDSEPASLEEWWRVVRERPLEALWMAALSQDKALKKEFAHLVQHCLENYRASPECAPPSWEFVDGILSVHADTMHRLRETEKAAEEGERRWEAERARLDELREELRRLRRENAQLRGEKAQAERNASALASQARATPEPAESRRLEEVERRLRKAEKEREHLTRELARARGEPAGEEGAHQMTPSAAEVDPPPPVASAERPLVAAASLADDPLPRRRVLRQLLRKLVKKGKIGASHTHEDNVYRGIADHEKGIAKEAMDLLYREGLLVPKPTVTDPHVSLSPERLNEVRSLIAGEFENPRLRQWAEE